MVDYWSKLEITDCWSEKERFNFVMGKIEESIVGDSELAERINEVISDLENIYIPVKVSDLENDVGFINEHQSLDEYITKSDTLGLVKNDGTIDTNDYVINEDLVDVIRKSDEVGLVKNDGSIDTNVYLTSHQDISDKVDRDSLSDVALSGSYNDLSDTPIIPEKISDLENDSDFLTEHQSLDEYISKSNVEGFVRNDGTIDQNIYLTTHQDISGKADLSDLSDVAFTGEYSDLENVPELPSKLSDLEDDKGFLTEHQNLDEYITKSVTEGLVKNDGSIDTNLYLTTHQDISMKANSSDLSSIALSGDYADLNNAPTIPEKLSDLEDDVGFITEHQSLENYVLKSDEVGLIKNDGTIDKTTYLTEHQDISDKVDRDSLSSVALSGEYSDLNNAPYIPLKVSDLDNDSGFLTEHQDISGKVDEDSLSDVAFTGDYTDLNNQPNIPSKTSELINDSNFLTQHQSLDEYISKSNTNGLIKNDGTIDTNSYLTSHQDISGKIDRTELFKNGLFSTTNTNSRGNTATIWNESDGGGVMFTDNTSNIVSFVGVNEGSRDGDLYVQIYSKDKTTSNGVRLNFNPNGAYYTVGARRPWTADDEIATKGDLNELIARIEELEAGINGSANGMVEEDEEI